MKTYTKRLLDKLAFSAYFLIFISGILFSNRLFAGNYPPDIERIINRGKLIVAMHSEDAPPFFMSDEKGRLYGFDVKLARDIGRRLGVEVEFKRETDTYDGVIDMIARREADIAISYLSKTLKLSMRVRLTEPYMTLNLALLVNRLMAAQKKKGQSMSEILKNMDEKIGVLAASSHIGYVKELFPRAEMKPYKAFDPYIVDAVFKGDVFAGFYDEVEIKRVIRKNSELSLKLKMVILKGIQDPIAIAVPWDSMHFLSWLNFYLSSIKLDVTADSVLDQYPEAITK